MATFLEGQKKAFLAGKHFYLAGHYAKVPGSKDRTPADKGATRRRGRDTIRNPSLGIPRSLHIRWGAVVGGRLSMLIDLPLLASPLLLPHMPALSRDLHSAVWGLLSWPINDTPRTVPSPPLPAPPLNPRPSLLGPEPKGPDHAETS